MAFVARVKSGKHQHPTEFTWKIASAAATLEDVFH
jgi:hypothetical protein